MRLEKIYYYDASVLVKLFLNEDGSNVVRQHRRNPEHKLPFYTTSLCFAETLVVLKMKYVRKEITQEQYLDAGDYLISCIREEDIQIANIDITDEKIFEEVEEIVSHHNIDISDAFQIVTIKQDYSSKELQMPAILITADRGLAKAARAEDLQVWDCMTEPAP